MLKISSMNKYLKVVTTIGVIIFLNSCDKVNDPYPPKGIQTGNGSLLGTLDSITVTNSTIADDELTELKAEYYFIAGSPNAAKIVFKWKDGMSDTLLATGTGSAISFTNVVVQVNGISPNGTLRFVYTANVTENFNGTGEIFVPAKPADQLQNVLIEDFTGQTCVNCPTAARTLYNVIEPTHPGRIVSMGVHAGTYAEPLAGDSCFSTDYRTQVGNDLDNQFTVTIANPTGMINRKTGAVGYVFFEPQWVATTNAEINNPAKVYIKTITDYNADDRKVTVTMGAGTFADELENYRVAMYVTEDSIIGCQKDKPPYPAIVYDYVHRHVLRDVVFSNWQGEDWASNPMGNVKRIKSYTYTLPDYIVAEHAAIVTIVYNVTSYKVIQVTEHKVME